MNKKILSGCAALVVIAVAAWNLNFSIKADKGMSDIALANVEALADETSAGCSGCLSGGCGSTQCSHSGSIAGTGYSCSVTCAVGWACCKATGCPCCYC